MQDPNDDDVGNDDYDVDSWMKSVANNLIPEHRPTPSASSNHEIYHGTYFVLFSLLFITILIINLV